jgi:hypothetical protein
MKDDPDRVRTVAPEHATYWRELGLPVTRTVNVPRRVDPVVRIRSVEVPGTATGLADHDAIEPLGAPLSDRVTEPVKPPTAPTATLYEAVCPRVTVIDGGVADTVKSRALAVRLTVAVCVIAPLVPLIVSW